MGHLIKTDTGGLIENYVVETKGGDKKLTLKAVETLASKIDDNLDHIYITPPPSRTVHHLDSRYITLPKQDFSISSGFPSVRNILRFHNRLLFLIV